VTTVPVRLGVLYWDNTLDNLSLIALTISTGFVITLFGLDHGVAGGLADDNADVERQVPEVPRQPEAPMRRVVAARLRTRRLLV
jgi:hypothetical protein